MQRKVAHVGTALLLAAIFLFCFTLFLEPRSSKMAHAAVLSPVSTATPSVTKGGIDWGNPIIIGALIALIGVLITAGTSLYLFRRTRQLEEVAATRTAKIREQEQQEKETEAVQSVMLRAKTLEERVQAYQKALHADPRLARLQILDMNRPLEVTDIYIRLRLHQETSPSYELDPALQDAQKRHDPNALLKAGQLRLERRASTALAPEEALRIHKHCVIVGDPGAGKTTLLKYLALPTTCAMSSPKCPGLLSGSHAPLNRAGKQVSAKRNGGSWTYSVCLALHKALMA